MTRPVWLPEELFPFESRYITVGTHSVHYIDEGSGPAILFVHGNPDYSLLYRHQIGALRAAYRCIALDLPGFGLSTPGAAFGFTPAEQVSAVEGFVQQLGLRDLVLVVHDWGGPIGLRAAQLGADRFRGLVIAGTLAWPDYRNQASWWVRLMMGFIASERGRTFTLKNNLLIEGPLRSEINRGAKPLDESTKAAYRGPFPTEESRVPTWVLAHHLWTRAGEEFLSTLEADMGRLRSLPVLLISGGADRYTPAEQMTARFAGIFPNHEDVVIPHAGHFFPESSPEETTEAIRAWLGQQPRSGH